ncbi:MAG: LicD family protein [Clostridia bacterium]|nr:LicD family protein [Clostridia bacterium]
MGLSTVDAFKHVKAGIDLSPEQLSQLQIRLKEILCDFEDCCKKHGIDYFAGGGTALGAYRHQGFIPWDDDIDLTITREDFKRFVEVFPKEMGEKYILQTPQTRPDFGLLIARIRLKNTSLRSREDLYNTDECGVFIELFIVENTFDNPVLRAIHGIGSMGLMFCVSCRRYKRDLKQFLNILEDPALAKTLRIKAAIGTLFSFMKLETWTRLADRWNGICKNNKSKLMTIPVGRLHFFGEIYPREMFYPPRPLPFEDTTVRCPNDTPGYLAHRYGPCYMTPPPKDMNAREAHIYLPPLKI